MRFLKVILIVLLFAGVIASCQKDNSVNLAIEKTGSTDTSNNAVNFLATQGILSVTVGDSTYTFDAAKDSIAFINVNIDSNKYFGITAINKQHTMSFGISSPGLASADLTNTIAGSQLLFSEKGSRYTLAPLSGPSKLNEITLSQYMQDSIISKGKFSAIMINKVGQDSSVVQAKGSFNLKK
jgi:hypothetical protein